MKRLISLTAAAVLCLSVVACGFDTAAAACEDAGTSFVQGTPVYNDDEGQETRCADGREVENAGDGMGWTVDD